MWCIDPCLGGTWTARGSPLPAPRSLAWHVKTTPTRFPRAGPCPRCPAVQVTTPSPCPSLSTIAFQLALPFFDPVHPTYTPSRPHHHPTVHCLAAIPGPKAPRPRTSLLRARHGGASKQPKHTDPTSPPAAAVSPEAAPNPKTPSIPHQQQPGRPPAPPVRGLSPRPGPGGKAVPAAVTLAARRTTTSLVRPACC